jgi:hypothetical protein
MEDRALEQLRGRLSTIPLPAVLQLLCQLHSSGRVRISQGIWSGEFALRGGEIVSARLAHEHGRAALEGMVLGFANADFMFAEEDVEDSEELLVSSHALADFLARMSVEREQLKHVTCVLDSVPQLVEDTATDLNVQPVTIDGTTLSLLPALVYGRTLEMIAQRRGLMRTLREVAALHAAGLVCLRPASTGTPGESTGPTVVPRGPHLARAIPPSLKGAAQGGEVVGPSAHGPSVSIDHSAARARGSGPSGGVRGWWKVLFALFVAEGPRTTPR